MYSDHGFHLRDGKIKAKGQLGETYGSTWVQLTVDEGRITFFASPEAIVSIGEQIADEGRVLAYQLAEWREKHQAEETEKENAKRAADGQPMAAGSAAGAVISIDSEATP